MRSRQLLLFLAAGFLSLAALVSFIDTQAAVCRKGTACAGRPVASPTLSITSPEETAEALSALNKESESVDEVAELVASLKTAGAGFFTAQANDKVYRCKTSYCTSMEGLDEGTKLVLRKNLSSVEFETLLGSESCVVKDCSTN